MHIVTTAASLLMVSITLLGIAGFAAIGLIAFGMAHLFSRVWDRLSIRLARARSRILPSAFTADDSRIRLKKMAVALEDNSIRDELTGLYNRRHFFTAFEVEWSRAARAGHHLAILLIDIDNFQQFIAASGQSDGDRLLRHIARSLGTRAFRKEDIVARIGPGEFALILPGSDLASSGDIADSIRAAISKTPPDGDLTPGSLVHVSIGASSSIPQQRGGPAKMIHEAELALDQARARGGNCVSLTQSIPAIPAIPAPELAGAARP